MAESTLTAPPPNAATERATLPVSGMTCAACVGRVERALQKAPGVTEAAVNLATERAAIRFDPARTDPAALAEVVRAAGYDVVEVAAEADRTDAEREARETERLAIRRRLLVAAAFTVPILLLSMGPMLVPGGHAWLEGLVSQQALYVVLFALATAVQFGPGGRFYRTGLAAARHGSPDMNTLVALGTTAAYSYSAVATFAPGLLPAGTAHVYYEASATIITLVLAGKYMEALAKGRTSEAVRRPPLAPAADGAGRPRRPGGRGAARGGGGRGRGRRAAGGAGAGGRLGHGRTLVRGRGDDLGRAGPRREDARRGGRRGDHQRDRKPPLPRRARRRRDRAGADRPDGRGGAGDAGPPCRPSRIGSSPCSSPPSSSWRR